MDMTFKGVSIRSFDLNLRRRRRRRRRCIHQSTLMHRYAQETIEL